MTKKQRNGCPFCGMGPVITVGGANDKDGFQAECANCGARGPKGMATAADAMRAWDVGDPPYHRPRVDPEAQDVYAWGASGGEEGVLPRFDEDCVPGALVCANPSCGSFTLHQFGVDVFHRMEDAETGLHVGIDGLKVASDQSVGDGDGNPSARRSGMVVRFWCEECDAVTTMSVSQHKGSTFIEMGCVHGEGRDDYELRY